MLAECDQAADLRGANLLDDVNNWLAHAERLDTQYRLRRRSTVELAADDVSLIGLIQLREQLAGRYRDKDGAVDLDRWVQNEAQKISDLI